MKQQQKLNVNTVLNKISTLKAEVIEQRLKYEAEMNMSDEELFTSFQYEVGMDCAFIRDVLAVGRIDKIEQLQTRIEQLEELLDALCGGKW
jgi:hypothetical protein